MDWMSGLQNNTPKTEEASKPAEQPGDSDWGAKFTNFFSGPSSNPPTTATTTIPQSTEKPPQEQQAASNNNSSSNVQSASPSLSDQFSNWTTNLFTPSQPSPKPPVADFSYVKHLGVIPETCLPAVVTQYVRQSMPNQVFPDEWEAFGRLKETEEAKHFCEEFLLACLFTKKLDVPRVQLMLQKNLAWRKENGFVEVPSWASLNKELFLSGFAMKIPGARTRRGEGVVYITMRHLIPKNHAPFIEHAIRWVVWHGMRASLWENCDYFRNGIVVVADLSDMGWDNLDLENATKMGSSFIDNFPMRLAKIILLRPPWLISTVLEAFRLFMKKKLMDRIINIEENEKLFEHIDAANLHVSFGGTLEYNIPQWFEFIESQYKEDEAAGHVEAIELNAT
jgi:hypothetical protein